MDSERVRELRTLMGVTQEGLADRMGVTVRTVSRWETGEAQIPEPSAKLLAMLAGVE